MLHSVTFLENRPVLLATWSGNYSASAAAEAITEWSAHPRYSAKVRRFIDLSHLTFGDDSELRAFWRDFDPAHSAERIAIYTRPTALGRFAEILEPDGLRVRCFDELPLAAQWIVQGLRAAPITQTPWMRDSASIYRQDQLHAQAG